MNASDGVNNWENGKEGHILPQSRWLVITYFDNKESCSESMNNFWPPDVL